jgi:hypothetical protein
MQISKLNIYNKKNALDKCVYWHKKVYKNYTFRQQQIKKPHISVRLLL